MFDECNEQNYFFLPTDGFRTLCEICWLDFGHKMADRNGTALASPDPNERAPIFLQVFTSQVFSNSDKDHSPNSTPKF